MPLIHWCLRISLVACLLFVWLVYGVNPAIDEWMWDCDTYKPPKERIYTAEETQAMRAREIKLWAWFITPVAILGLLAVMFVKLG
jgi:hypothetical protein